MFTKKISHKLEIICVRITSYQRQQCAEWRIFTLSVLCCASPRIRPWIVGTWIVFRLQNHNFFSNDLQFVLKQQLQIIFARFQSHRAKVVFKEIFRILVCNFYSLLQNSHKIAFICKWVQRETLSHTKANNFWYFELSQHSARETLSGQQIQQHMLVLLGCQSKSSFHIETFWSPPRLAVRTIKLIQKIIESGF